MCGEASHIFLFSAISCHPSLSKVYVLYRGAFMYNEHLLDFLFMCVMLIRALFPIQINEAQNVHFCFSVETLDFTALQPLYPFMILTSIYTSNQKVCVFIDHLDHFSIKPLILLAFIGGRCFLSTTIFTFALFKFLLYSLHMLYKIPLYSR